MSPWAKARGMLAVTVHKPRSRDSRNTSLLSRLSGLASRGSPQAYALTVGGAIFFRPIQGFLQS